MGFQNFFFCIILIVAFKSSVQWKHKLNEFEDDYEEYTDEPAPKEIEYRNITVDKGSDVLLKCSAESGEAKWEIGREDNNQFTSTKGTNGFELLIKNITENYTNKCLVSDKIEQYFEITVEAPQTPTLNQSAEFVEYGSIVHVSCVARSYFPVDTAYLRVEIDDWNSTENHRGQWVSKKRICMNNDYNRTDCVMETTFQYDVKVLHDLNLFCGYENAESESLHVQIMETDITTYKDTTKYYYAMIQSFFGTAKDALRKYGVSEDAASYVRQQLNDIAGPNTWNCIISRRAIEVSLSPELFGETKSSLSFSVGSVFFYIFQTKK